MFVCILFSLHNPGLNPLEHQLLPAQAKRPAPEKPSTWKRLVTEQRGINETTVTSSGDSQVLHSHAPHYYFINLSGSSFILER